MYFLYVDESGDTGLAGSPTKYFCLSGLVFHELRWHETLEAVIDFRRKLKADYGLKLREEIHAAHYIHKPGPLSRIAKSIRLKMLKEILEFQASLPDISVLNVVVDKSSKTAADDVFEIAWTTLIQRFHNTISRKNFAGPQNPDDHGMLIVGLPYTETELFQTKTGGTPYGATRLTDDLELTPLSDEERKLCLAIGKRVAITAKKLL